MFFPKENHIIVSCLKYGCLEIALLKGLIKVKGLMKFSVIFHLLLFKSVEAQRCSDWHVWLSIRLSEDCRVIGSRLPWALHLTPCYEIPLIDVNVSLHDYYDNVYFVLVLNFCVRVLKKWSCAVIQRNVPTLKCHCKILLFKIAVWVLSPILFARLQNFKVRKFWLFHFGNIKFL